MVDNVHGVVRSPSARGFECGTSSDFRQVADQLASKFDPKWKASFERFPHRHPLQKISGVSYEWLYGPLLAPLRYKPISMVEMGVRNGDSQLLWREYFPRAKMILGLGLPSVRAGPQDGMHPGSHKQIAPNNIIIYCSQIDTKCIQKFGRTHGPFDLIIDDASHVPQHNIFSMIAWWPYLKPGGTYVIEDMQTSYWMPGSRLYGNSMRGTGLLAPGNAIEYLKNTVDLLNLNHQVRSNRTAVIHPTVDAEIGTITFATWVAQVRYRE